MESTYKKRRRKEKLDLLYENKDSFKTKWNKRISKAKTVAQVKSEMIDLVDEISDIFDHMMK